MVVFPDTAVAVFSAKTAVLFADKAVAVFADKAAVFEFGIE
jgi:hypothetical protein